MTPPLSPEEIASIAAQNPGAARAAVLHAIERSLGRRETSPRLRSVARALLDAGAPSSTRSASPEPLDESDALAPLDAAIDELQRALERADPDGADGAAAAALLDRLASLEERYADELSRRFARRKSFDSEGAAHAMQSAAALLAKHAGAASDDASGE